MTDYLDAITQKKNVAAKKSHFVSCKQPVCLVLNFTLQNKNSVFVLRKGLTEDGKKTRPVSVQFPRSSAQTNFCWRGVAGDMSSRSHKRRRCIHGHKVRKQALRQEFTQKTVELCTSANADAATQRYVKTCGKKMPNVSVVSSFCALRERFGVLSSF